MAKKIRSYLPTTRAAVALLGTQIAQARRERGWTAGDLADRLDVTPATVSRVERGEPTVAVGTAFEAAAVLGVPLFTDDAADLGGLVAAARQRLALLPARVARVDVDVDDDF